MKMLDMFDPPVLSMKAKSLKLTSIVSLINETVYVTSMTKGVWMAAAVTYLSSSSNVWWFIFWLATCFFLHFVYNTYLKTSSDNVGFNLYFDLFRRSLVKLPMLCVHSNFVFWSNLVLMLFHYPITMKVRLCLDFQIFELSDFWTVKTVVLQCCLVLYFPH